MNETTADVLSLTNPPGHLWHDKWTALSGPLSMDAGSGFRVESR